jgi:hypothetical protein
MCSRLILTLASLLAITATAEANYVANPTDRAVRVQIANFHGPDISAWVKCVYLDRETLA